MWPENEPVKAARPAVDSTVQTPFFSATARIELEGMKATILQHINGKILEDMPKAIEEAFSRVVAEGQWHAMIQAEVQKVVQETIRDTVKAALTMNFDLRAKLNEHLTQEVGKIITDLLGKKKS